MNQVLPNSPEATRAPADFFGPIAPDLESSDRLIDAARAAGRILQVGHLERFNPAVAGLERVSTLPLF